MDATIGILPYTGIGCSHGWSGLFRMPPSRRLHERLCGKASLSRTSHKKRCICGPRDAPVLNAPMGWRTEKIVVANLNGGSRRLASSQPLAQLLRHLVEPGAIGDLVHLGIAGLCHQPARNLQVEMAPARPD